MMNIFDMFRKRKEIPAPWSKYYRDDELVINIPNISLYKQLLNTSNKYPNNTAYRYFGKNVSFQTFIKQIDKAAISFKKLNVQKGNVVTICLPNLPETLIAFYALNKLGAIANMVHPLSAEEEIKDAVISTKSKYLIMLDQFYIKVKDIVGNTKLKNVIFVSPSDSMNIFMKLGYKLININKYKKYPKNDFYMSWQKFTNKSRNSKIKITEKYGKDTPAVILHSGGTSGKPKNVVLQNRAFVMAAIQEKRALKNLNVGDSVIAIMPNFHGFGLSVCMHSAMVLGCTTVLVPQFDSKKFDILFDKNKPTVIIGVPTLYEALLSNNNVKNLDMSFVKYAISGGDILSKSLEDKVNAYFKEHNSKARITQGYGMTECLAAVCLACDDVNKSGSIGIPLPGNYIKIINPSTRKTNPYNVVGEICINTKALMMGYLNNESETNTALQIHDDGHVWLHSGDLGYMDEDGFIFCKGRLKRMIITSGYNVYPSHIEEVIESHPAVLQCTVVGVPHPYKQEVPKAFIVLKEGYFTMFVKNEIKEYCKKNLAKYMVPHDFVYRKKLPKTKIGKVDFKKLESDIGRDDE
ncbi:MAG: long-chain fatty acid--CoA ligase [Firmicutes bacterium]|nr:long-chain fatty acid--CoA ligase [Bacillota bacterium]